MERIERPLYEDRILGLLGRGEVVVLTGHRRAGKSCILESLSEKLSERGKVLYLDMEDPRNADINNYVVLNDWISSQVSASGKSFLLIDEVQEISEFEKTLRFWAKQDNIDVIVTGSNANMLSSDIASIFAGRYARIHIYSLSYSEFLLFNHLSPSQSSLAAYFQWGGLPFLHNIPETDTRSKIDYLKSIFDTILVKDVVTRRQIRNVTFITNLARFIAENSGKLFSASSIAKYMKGKDIVVSSNTISDYLETLCSTYLVDRVSRYDIKGKRIFEQQEKYYFEDIGVRNYLCMGKERDDLEKVLETAVYLKLKRDGYDVYVGQHDGKEIDFVATRGDDVNYYQVSLQVSQEETYKREFGNLKRIQDNYPKYLITMDPMASFVNDAGIIVKQADEFLLD